MLDAGKTRDTSIYRRIGQRIRNFIVILLLTRLYFTIALKWILTTKRGMVEYVN